MVLKLQGIDYRFYINARNFTVGVRACSPKIIAYRTHYKFSRTV